MDYTFECIIMKFTFSVEDDVIFDVDCIRMFLEKFSDFLLRFAA